MKQPTQRRVTTLASALAAAFVALGATGAADKAKPYAMHVSATPQKPTAGSKASFALTIAPEGEWKLKPETPFKAVLKPSEGLSLNKTTLTAEDFESNDTPSKTVKADVTAQQRGTQSIAVDLTFFLCTDQICQRYKDATQLTIEVGEG